MGGVAVEDGGVAGTDLTGVVHDDDLGVEGSGLLGGVVLRVRADVTSSDVLDGHVLHVEADVVSGETLGDLLADTVSNAQKVYGLRTTYWCISTDLTSVVTLVGAKVTTMPALMTPVSTRPTGTVPIPPIL